jgi:hypothetical protein
MLKALDLTRTKTVELSSDPDKGTPQASRFVIRALDGRLTGILRDKCMEVKIDTTNPDAPPETTLRMYELTYMAVQYGLVSVENFRDAEGNDFTYGTVKRNMGGKSYTAVSDSFLRNIPSDALMELGQEVLDLSEVEETEGKP